MRLVATEYLSLDGIFEEPGHWSHPFFSEDAGQFKWNELQESDALLLGRTTYQGFAQAWPSMQGTGEFGVKMNTMTKYVVSSTLEKVEWPGSKLIKGNAADEIRKLKQAPGKDLLLCGSAQLFNALMHDDLIDLYRILLFPIVLGQGKRLFAEGTARKPFSLSESRRLTSGALVLEYARAAKS